MATFDLDNAEPKPGDALRDEAANILTTKFGTATREKRVQGKKVDLYFTENKFGRESKVFLEAKDYAKALTREQVVHIWSDYSGIVGQQQPAILLIVTRVGLTTDAQAYVNDEQTLIRHQTIRQLENETLGLTSYVRSLTSLFEEDGLKKYYIETRASSVRYTDAGTTRIVDGPTFPLFAVLETWLADPDNRPIAILGGYGAGKSSLAKRLVSAQAQKALADPFARMPVLVRLGELWRYSSLEGLLGGMFTHDFPVDGFNTRTFLHFNRRGRFLIVLDGFDEMKHAMTWTDFRQQILDLTKLVGDEAKVVLLGRPSAFTSAEEQLHVLRGLKKWEGGYRKLPDWPEFIEYDLAEFTQAERSEFISAYLAYRAPTRASEWRQARVAEVENVAANDPEIFGKPVHAKILVDMASDPDVDLAQFAAGITRWGLYEVFFNELAERETEKASRRPIAEAHRIEFLQEVAYWLWTAKSQATSFSAGDLPDAIIANLPFGDAADLDALKREYLTGAFLEKKSGDVYFFGHRSFAEFLVADRMTSKVPGPAEQATYSALVRDGVAEFLREAPRRNVYGEWAGELVNARGGLHVEYLVFLGRMLGGKREFLQLVHEKSVWPSILDVFDDDMSMSGHLAARIAEAMETPSNDLFFLLLSMLQYQGALQAGRQIPMANLVAAAILSRVFEPAELDPNSRKASVSDEHNEARMLASRVIGGLEEGIGERRMLFHGGQLLRLKAEHLRSLGLDLVMHPPAALLSFDDQMPLRWSHILELMRPAPREKARRYFQRSRNLQDVFTRSSSGGPRHIVNRPLR